MYGIEKELYNLTLVINAGKDCMAEIEKNKQDETQKLENSIKELEEKIDWFYSDDFELEEATTNYRTAIALAKELQEDLNNLQNEIEVLKEDFSK